MTDGTACIGSVAAPTVDPVHPVRRPEACPETRVGTQAQAARTRPTMQRPVRPATGDCPQ